MTRSSTIRRHPDGAIDFDHYRRAAADERHEAIHRCVAAVCNAVAAIVARSSIIPRRYAASGRESTHPAQPAHGFQAPAAPAPE